jgi:preprotein translocase subunit SecG
MQNVVLIIHLILALCLIGVVLLQRSEGGALGIGGGGGGLVSQRGAATALSKITWVLAASFLCTSILLTILASDGGSGSLLDQFQADPDAAIPLPELLTTDPGSSDLLPPAETVPAAPAPSE